MPGRGVMSALPTPARSVALRSDDRGVACRTRRLMVEWQPVNIHAASTTAVPRIHRSTFNLLRMFNRCPRDPPRRSVPPDLSARPLPESPMNSDDSGSPMSGDAIVTGAGGRYPDAPCRVAPGKPGARQPDDVPLRICRTFTRSEPDVNG